MTSFVAPLIVVAFVSAALAVAGRGEYCEGTGCATDGASFLAGTEEIQTNKKTMAANKHVGALSMLQEKIRTTKAFIESANTLARSSRQ
ncbi:unnamed protein product [Vitrella brassicaformis CCMP3155]|uniref:Uncharacterized protein n=1 Tax=Vitrella brassicaformis (strain CCMP3155) TaxID=1169540 RepID=A0A0G4H621_VITBC|nr:unnamed protein product [Vitrella brassicaformis CCMP3155]|eukprot:CEM39037.1 unnamed protein product [Vitrella brassicaformis CCMP3155]